MGKWCLTNDLQERERSNSNKISNYGWPASSTVWMSVSIGSRHDERKAKLELLHTDCPQAKIVVVQISILKLSQAGMIGYFTECTVFRICIIFLDRIVFMQSALWSSSESYQALLPRWCYVQPLINVWCYTGRFLCEARSHCSAHGALMLCVRDKIHLRCPANISIATYLI